MIFNEKDELTKIYLGVKPLRNMSGSKTLKAMMDLNKSILDITIASIKNKKHKIKEKQLIKELKMIYWGESR